MILFKRLIGMVFLGSACALCDLASAAEITVSRAPPITSAAASDRLARLTERYWEAYLALNPGYATAIGEHRFDAHLENPASLQYLADSLAIERAALAELVQVPAGALNAPSRLSFDIFKYDRETAIRGYLYPEELLPLSLTHSMALNFTHLASGEAGQTFHSAQDYENWLARIQAFEPVMAQSITNLREGVRRGYTAPRVLIDALLPRVAALMQDQPSNVFYTPLHRFPTGMPSADRERIAHRLTAALRDEVFPAYRALHDYLQNEYRPVARASIGLSALPLGEAWYASRIQRATSTSMSAQQIHDIGKVETARLRERLQARVTQTGYAGDLPAYFALLAQDPHVELEPMRSALPTPFETQQQRHELPHFRRFSTAPALTQGWPLYAATLSEELRADTDPNASIHVLLADLKCSVALVVDTGIHAQNWTAAQSVDYLTAQLPMSKTAAMAQLALYISDPGDALACKIGEMKIRALRTQAQAALGARFDIQDFHTQILNEGAIPLGFLETKIAAWIKSVLSL